jgi:hypothetical protein
MKKACLLLIMIAACGKDEGSDRHVIGACLQTLEAGPHRCFEFTGDRVAYRKGECAKDRLSSWVAACPRDGVIGGCRDVTAYSTEFFYGSFGSSIDKVRAACDSPDEQWIEAPAAAASR